MAPSPNPLIYRDNFSEVRAKNGDKMAPSPCSKSHLGRPLRLAAARGDGRGRATVGLVWNKQGTYSADGPVGQDKNPQGPGRMPEAKDKTARLSHVVVSWAPSILHDRLARLV